MSSFRRGATVIKLRIRESCDKESVHRHSATEQAIHALARKLDEPAAAGADDAQEGAGSSADAAATTAPHSSSRAAALSSRDAFVSVAASGIGEDCGAECAAVPCGAAAPALPAQAAVSVRRGT